MEMVAGRGVVVHFLFIYVLIVPTIETKTVPKTSRGVGRKKNAELFLFFFVCEILSVRNIEHYD